MPCRAVRTRNEPEKSLGGRAEGCGKEWKRKVAKRRNLAEERVIGRRRCKRKRGRRRDVDKLGLKCKLRKATKEPLAEGKRCKLVGNSDRSEKCTLIEG